MKKFAVIGLGTFGKSLAMELAESDAEVLAIDISEERINEISHPNITAVKFDSTDIKELERFGIKDTDAVIVTIGENFEALLLTCVLLKELGVKRIIARANEEIHKKILKSIGIREEDIITPEEEVAKRLSKLLLSEGFIEFFEITKDYEIFDKFLSLKISPSISLSFIPSPPLKRSIKNVVNVIIPSPPS